jgi:tetratricopeptide (TPR) repeat protein
MRNKIPWLILILMALCLIAALAYRHPVVRDRLTWEFSSLRAKIKYMLNPPEKEVFIPSQGSTPRPATATAVHTATATNQTTPTQAELTPQPSETATLTPLPTATATAIPDQFLLTGFTHEYQKFNNCGPANLSMALSYWGWQGTQLDTAAFLKPNQRDKNVSPEEMARFVNENTNFHMWMGVGGDLALLKKFVAAGFPVIVEKGFEGVRFDGWMGHYQVVNGYDNATEMFTVQDSYDGPNRTISYQEMEQNWRAFNFVYLVAYPPEREGDLASILGMNPDLTAQYEQASQKAEAETQSLTGRDLFFAWYNLGTNHTGLGNFPAAAQAFDQAFAVYPTIYLKQRPWRMLWYQFGPYQAYFAEGRYQDVIDLADKTLREMSEPVLEESYYWRGQAKEALGDTDGAVLDYQKCLAVHAEYEPCIVALDKLGVQP